MEALQGLDFWPDSEDPELQLMELLKVAIRFNGKSADLQPASERHLERIGKLIQDARFSAFGLKATGYMAVGDKGSETSLVQCQRVREILLNQGVMNPVSVHRVGFGDEQGPRVSFTLAPAPEVAAECEAEIPLKSKEAAQDALLSGFQTGDLEKVVDLTKPSTEDEQLEVPCTLESFNGQWFRERDGLKMCEIRDGVITWEASSFAPHKVAPVKIQFKDARIYVHLSDGLYYACLGQDTMFWSDGDIWERDKK